MCEEEGGALIPLSAHPKQPLALQGDAGSLRSSPARAWDPCKVPASCLILPSTAPALPRTCRDLDAF